jgi:hypothetical protein
MNLNISKWFKEKMPDTYQFFKNFFLAMNNKSEGHSLRKWLAVGFFWLCAECVFRFTTTENVAIVLGILTGMITALVITYSVTNSKSNKEEPKDPTNEQV